MSQVDICALGDKYDSIHKQAVVFEQPNYYPVNCVILLPLVMLVTLIRQIINCIMKDPK